MLLLSILPADTSKSIRLRYDQQNQKYHGQVSQIVKARDKKGIQTSQILQSSKTWANGRRGIAGSIAWIEITRSNSLWQMGFGTIAVQDTSKEAIAATAEGAEQYGQGMLEDKEIVPF